MSTLSGKSGSDTTPRNHVGIDKEQTATLVNNNISYRTLSQSCPSCDGIKCPGTESALCSRVPKAKSAKKTITPISNLPAFEPVTTVVPSDRDMLVFRLRRELRLREQQLGEALYKLSRALETLVSEEQFFNDGMQRDTWETYDQLMKRRARLRATRELIMSASSTATLDEKEEREFMMKIGMGDE